MKNVFFLALCIILFTFTAKAQTDSAESSPVRIDAGFMLAPQGELSLRDPKAGFNTIVPLFAVLSITKGKLNICPFYNLTFNSTGAAITYEVSPTVGIYTVGVKNVLDKGGYAGLGIAVPVANRTASAFIEGGSVFPSGETFMYTGVFIPLTFKVK